MVGDRKDGEGSPQGAGDSRDKEGFGDGREQAGGGGGWRGAVDGGEVHYYNYRRLCKCHGGLRWERLGNTFI